MSNIINVIIIWFNCAISEMKLEKSNTAYEGLRPTINRASPAVEKKNNKHSTFTINQSIFNQKKWHLNLLPLYWRFSQLWRLLLWQWAVTGRSRIWKIRRWSKSRSSRWRSTTNRRLHPWFSWACSRERNRWLPASITDSSSPPRKPTSSGPTSPLCLPRWEPNP